MPKNRKERNENNVKIIYVWNILGRNRAAHGYGSKFFQSTRSGIVINLILTAKEVRKIVTAILLILVKDGINVDTFRYKDLVRECFGNI